MKVRMQGGAWSIVASALAAFLLLPVAARAQPPVSGTWVVVPSSTFNPQVVNHTFGPGISTCYAQSTLSYTYTIPNVTAGNAVVGSIIYEGNGAGMFCPGPNTAGDVTAISVNGTAATIVDYDGSNRCCGPGILTWWANVNAGTTITVTTTGGIYNEFWTAVEFSGISGATLDPNGHAAHYEGDVSNTLSSPTVTPSQSGELFYGMGVHYNGGNNQLLPGTGWTILSSYYGDQAGYFPGTGEYQIYNSTAPLAVTSSSVHENWAVIIGIKP